MFFHVIIGVTGITSTVEKNKSREDILTEFICPFVNREITFWDGKLFNMSSYGHVIVIKTDKPIDSDWPIKKTNYIKEGETELDYKYKYDLRDRLKEVGEDVTEELYKEAIALIDSGRYTELRRTITEQEKGMTAFFICPFENEEVDHNYTFIIKPCVEKHQFEIKRADEISHTRAITDVIIGAINKARFIIADLTDEKPNCYYEVGYAHSIGKPVLIIAKEGTSRHFDLAAHKWTYWSDYKDLKPKLEKEIEGVLSELGIKQ